MSKITHVMSVDLVPADAMAALKLREALDEMCAADPTLGVAIGPVNELVLQGVSELHLEIAVDILKRGKGWSSKSARLRCITASASPGPSSGTTPTSAKPAARANMPR